MATFSPNSATKSALERLARGTHIVPWHFLPGTQKRGLESVQSAVPLLAYLLLEVNPDRKIQRINIGRIRGQLLRGDEGGGVPVKPILGGA